MYFIPKIKAIKKFWVRTEKIERRPEGAFYTKTGGSPVDMSKEHT